MATGNCEGAITATTTTVFPVMMSETVTWIYTDVPGNVSTQTQAVVIEDVTDPVLECSDDFMAMADNADNTYTIDGIILDLLSYDDNCEVESVSNDFNNLNTLDGAVFNQGFTEVVWTVQDVAGNTTTCSIEVNIEEYVGVDELLNTTVFNVYPNPSNGQFSLNLSSELKGEYEIEIVNSVGTSVYSNEGMKSSKEMLESIKIDNLASGIYYLNIQLQNTSLQKKIVILD